MKVIAFLSFLFFGWGSNMSKVALKHHAQDCKGAGRQVSVLPSPQNLSYPGIFV
jgi:hypothetical protein